MYDSLSIPTVSKKTGMSVEAQDLLLPSRFYFKVPCILEENN
jgi:hypothetical protein